MIIQFLNKREQLTNAEKSIADYLLNKHNDINHLTSIELGRLSFTSQSAVTRLYKKLGFTSFRSFLSRLIIERKEYYTFNTVVEIEENDYFASLEDIEGVISSLYMKSIIHTNSILDKNVVNRLINYLMSAQTIDVYGQGISETNAKQLVYKLQSLGLSCSYQMHLIPKYIENMKFPNKHVVIIFCVEKSRATIRELVKKMRSKGIYTIVITCHQDDPINSLVNDVIRFDISEFKDVEHLTSTFSAEYITNIIYSMLYYRIFVQNKKEK